MRHAIKTLVLIASFYPVLAGADLTDFPSVFAEGRTSLDVPPDKATINFYISAFDADSDKALAVVQTQIAEALEILAAAGIPKEAITAYNLSKEVERARQDRHELEILGYFITREFRVELNDLEIFSDVVASLITVNHLTSIRAKFDVKDRASVEARLVHEAAADARAKATNLAEGMGVQLGPVFLISQESLNSYSADFRLRDSTSYAMSIAAPARDTIFVPATINLGKNVNAIFRISD